MSPSAAAAPAQSLPLVPVTATMQAEGLPLSMKTQFGHHIFGHQRGLRTRIQQGTNLFGLAVTAEDGDRHHLQQCRDIIGFQRRCSDYALTAGSMLEASNVLIWRRRRRHSHLLGFLFLPHTMEVGAVLQSRRRYGWSLLGRLLQLRSGLQLRAAVDHCCLLDCRRRMMRFTVVELLDPRSGSSWWSEAGWSELQWAVEESRLKVKAQAEQDELRLRTRAEQLDVEIQLAELGQVDESALEPLRVTVSEASVTPGSFLTESLARRLKVRRDDTSISIETVGNERRVMQTSLASGLEVCGLDGAEFLPLPPLLTIDRIPVTQSDRCRMVSGEKERPKAARTR
ncbi:hypothetical protein FJT64_008873 [Amphibalanus amphitrite]|uniref:Uncharacterized protein n=1 Tax=Amphibalanus amphitrite TaxID=1232801 RepID=A0A6A4VAC9_AMPAM|nr:hypothetical protein FJT64_008873 [Amphibalanus amphitrite]